MRKTKIICTIGPASESEDKLRELMLAGMDVARFNFSHGSHEEHKKKICEGIKDKRGIKTSGGYSARYKRTGNQASGF